MAIITARGFGYRHASRKNPAFSDLDFTVDRGEKLLLLGASGSGKSTLLAAIAGVLGSDDGDFSGELTVSGVVGMVLQDPNSQVIASRVGDDVAFGCENLGVSREETWRRVRRGLELVGLDLPLNHPTAELSGGQKQRVAIARALAPEPSVLLCDEPTSALDTETTRSVLATLKEINQRLGVTIVIVTHELSVVLALCRQAAVVEQGLLVEKLDLDGSAPLAPVSALGRELVQHLQSGHGSMAAQGAAGHAQGSLNTTGGAQAPQA